MTETSCLLILVGFLILVAVRDYCYQNYLLQAAKDKGSICIRGQFFKLLTEKEYLEMK